ncbi:MAG: hypothetical protein GX216_01510 [Methanomicrobiales archaeon]|nr:hypothetical protein [Methanomicrobiales archaeon]
MLHEREKRLIYSAQRTRILALCSAALGRSLKGGVVMTGGMSVGGTVEPAYNALDMPPHKKELRATTITPVRA